MYVKKIIPSLVSPKILELIQHGSFGHKVPEGGILVGPQSA